MFHLFVVLYIFIFSKMMVKVCWSNDDGNEMYSQEFDDKLGFNLASQLDSLILLEQKNLSLISFLIFNLI